MATITHSKTGTYSARIRTKGFPTVCKTFHSLRDAQAWCKRVESDQQRGAWQMPSPLAAMTLQAALDRYCKEVTSLKKGAIPEGYMIAAIKRSMLTTKLMTSVKGADIATLRDIWLREGLAPATVRQRMAIISHCYTIAFQEWGLDALNPVTKIKKPTVKNARERRLMDGELDAVITATRCKDLPAVAKFAIETAMRLSEIVSLRWTDINITSRTATLNTTKNGSRRVVPISPAALQVLTALPRRIDGRLLGVTGPAITRAWIRAVKKARVTYENDCVANGRAINPDYLVGLHLHDLRHEATSRLFERGVFNVMEIASITGHKTLQMLARYTHVQASQLAEKLALA